MIDFWHALIAIKDTVLLLVSLWPYFLAAALFGYVLGATFKWAGLAVVTGIGVIIALLRPKSDEPSEIGRDHIPKRRQFNTKTNRWE